MNIPCLPDWFVNRVRREIEIAIFLIGHVVSQFHFDDVAGFRTGVYQMAFTLFVSDEESAMQCEQPVDFPYEHNKRGVG